MNAKLRGYVRKIENLQELSEDDILKLGVELDEYLETLPQDEIDEFAYSGYGEMLYMVTSGIRYQRENKIQ